MRRKGPPRVLGPYPERNRYRLVVIENSARKSVYIGTLEEAERMKGELGRMLERPVTRRIEELLEAYGQHRVSTGRCSERTNEDQMSRLFIFFDGHLANEVGSLSPRIAQQLYTRATEQKNAKNGEPVSAATHRFYLALAKSFFNWCVKQNHVKENPFKDVHPVGKVRVGKPQLRIDEARRFADTAMKMYEQNNDLMALGALMALLIGLRASEVLNRVGRDVDDSGRMLWIDSGKTHNARRHLRVPEVLQPHLVALSQSAGADGFLFARGGPQPPRRQALHSAVRRVCERAGVPRVCPHSLRGLYATLAVESGAVSDAVAASLGHGSFSMTSKHYAQPSSVRNAQTARVIDKLVGDRSPVVSAPSQRRAEELLETLDPDTTAQLMLLLQRRMELVGGKG